MKLSGLFLASFVVAVVAILYQRHLYTSIKRTNRNQQQILEASQNSSRQYFKVVTRSKETNGKHFEIEEFQRVSGCGAGKGPCTPPIHSHPKQTETFYILAGKFRWWLEGKTGVASANETVVIPPGAFHTWWIEDGTTEDVRIRFRLEPALDGEEFFEMFSGALYDGNGDPGAIQMLSLLCKHHMAIPAPEIVNRAICFFVPYLGQLMGVQTFYPEYRSA